MSNGRSEQAEIHRQTYNPQNIGDLPPRKSKQGVQVLIDQEKRKTHRREEPDETVEKLNNQTVSDNTPPNEAETIERRPREPDLLVQQFTQAQNDTNAAKRLRTANPADFGSPSVSISQLLSSNKNAVAKRVQDNRKRRGKLFQHFGIGISLTYEFPEKSTRSLQRQFIERNAHLSNLPTSSIQSDLNSEDIGLETTIHSEDSFSSTSIVSPLPNVQSDASSTASDKTKRNRDKVHPYNFLLEEVEEKCKLCSNRQ